MINWTPIIVTALICTTVMLLVLRGGGSGDE